jgi:hypothetical protein
LVGLLAYWVILGAPVLYVGDDETLATPEAAPDTIGTVIEERDTHPGVAYEVIRKPG